MHTLSLFRLLTLWLALIGMATSQLATALPVAQDTIPPWMADICSTSHGNPDDTGNTAGACTHCCTSHAQPLPLLPHVPHAGLPATNVTGIVLPALAVDVTQDTLSCPLARGPPAT